MNNTNQVTYKKDSEKVATVKVCILIFAMACTQACIVGDVFSIWLQSNLGLTGAQIGELFAIKSLFAIFYKPIFGYLLDRFRLKKGFILSIPILGILIGPFFQYIYTPLLAHPSTFLLGGILGGLFFGYVIVAGGAAVLSYCDRYIRAHGGTVGKVTAFFAGGVAAMGFISTVLYNINPMYNFYLAGGFAIITTIMILSFKTEIFYHIDTDIIPKKPICLEDVKVLFKDLNFLILVSFVIFCTAIQWISNAQLGNYTTSFWSDKSEAVKIIGYFAIPFGILTFTELMFASQILKKIGVRKGIVIVHLIAITFFVVVGIAGFAHSKVIYLGSRFLGETSNSLFYVTILTYISTKFDTRVSGIAFLVGFHFLNNLTMVLAGTELGHVFDKYGFSQGYIYLAIISSCGLLLTLILMGIARKKEQRALQNQPA